jgi:hypothetical protein
MTIIISVVDVVDSSSIHSSVELALRTITLDCHSKQESQQKLGAHTKLLC